MSLLEEGSLPMAEGMTLPPMVAAAGPSSIEAVFQTRAALQADRWQAIVIHHSATPYATPDQLDLRHRQLGLSGLGYHFVIGNGRGMADGEIHAGYRWMEQLPGAHVAGVEGSWYNRHAIGICLVGDGRRRPFTRTQLARLVQLCAALAEALDIPAERIVLHSDLANTNDPGRYFPQAAFYEQLAAQR